MRNRIMSFLLVLVIAFMPAGCYHGGDKQSERYREVKLTEKQKSEIAEMAAQRIIEAQKLKIEQN